MWGAIIGAAGGLAGSLIGGHNARKAARRQRAIYKNQLTEARANALRYANQDFSQSAAAQDALAATSRLNQQSMQDARGADAVTGGHSTANAVQANANAQAQLASSLAQQGQAQQQQARQYYGNQVQAAQNQLAGMYGQQATNNTNAANQAMKAGMGMVQADMQSHIGTGHGLLHNMFGLGGKSNNSSAGTAQTPAATAPATGGGGSPFTSEQAQAMIDESQRLINGPYYNS